MMAFIGLRSQDAYQIRVCSPGIEFYAFLLSAIGGGGEIQAPAIFKRE